MTFTPDELERYARHIVLREIGGPGQQRLSAATVAVIGAGGLGSPALLYLAAAGIGTLRVIDDDAVSLSNLQRQVLHDSAAVGAPKTDSARASLSRINPHVAVDTRPVRLEEGNAADLLTGADCVLDGSDSFATRQVVNAAATSLGIPLVSAAMSQWEGQITVFDPRHGAPCYACVFPNAPADGIAPSCAEAGVMGALAGVMGSMMAGEAIKLICDAGQPLRGEMLIFDALWGDSRKITLRRDPACRVCGAIAPA